MPGMNMLPGGTTLQIPLDAPAGFTAKAGNAQVTLTWTDPKDKYATPEGETAQDPDQLVSVWDHTVLVRKTGSQPAGPNDGTVVVSSSVRDQYASAGYVDTGLQNDTTYYYGVFAYNTDGVASPGAFASATPIAGTPLGNLAEGTLIKILENGSPVEFYLAKHNYEPGLNGQGRELLVRKDSIGSMEYNSKSSSTSLYTNSYANSDIKEILNSTFLDRFSSFVKNLIGTTQIQTDSSTTSDENAFILSVTEYGFTNFTAIEQSRTPVLGSPVPIADILKAGASKWTRTPYNLTPFRSVYSIIDNGNRAYVTLIGNTNNVFPAITLPSSSVVNADLELMEE